MRKWTRRNILAATGATALFWRVPNLFAADEIPGLPAFEPGEKLRYRLYWSFMRVGGATSEVLPDATFEGMQVRQFKMTIRTASIVDKIYKVRDTLTAYTNLDVSRSLWYEKIQREGDTKKDVEVAFDWEKKQATYTDRRKQRTRDPIDILEGCLDPLSAFYFVRNQKLEVGAVLRGPITDGKKCIVAEMKVVKREKIKIKGKKYWTFLVVPDIKDVGGVFKKSKNAKLEIWVTADHRHIPVRMRSKVVVGSFHCELIA